MSRQAEADFRKRLATAVHAAHGLEIAVDDIPITYPPNPELGDLASPLCLQLARTLKRAPRQIADAIAEAFETGGAVAHIDVAGAGYLNATYDRAGLVRELLRDGFASTVPTTGTKVIVEHTNINPNKAAHIGHLRNAVLGDTLVRFLRRLGRDVEIQNYIDDTGVQLCDLVVGFTRIRGEDLATIEEKYSEEALAARGERFDYIAWDLYAEVGRYYEADESRLELRQEVLHAVEEGGNPIAELGDHLARRMVQHHLGTMYRLGVVYDVLPRESDILALRFWDAAFERLQAHGAIQRAESGKNAGCWVMDMPGAEEGAGEDQKVIVRSNGTVTYVGKDIAYQMWKFGLLGKDFHYRRFDWSPRPELYPVWSTHAGDDAQERPAFGTGELVYNVIDTRQAYLQRVVAAGLESLGHREQAERSIHFSYEMVALTPAAVTQLFPEFELSEAERGKPYLEMSGRKGLGVRADDLLDELHGRAAAEIRSRNADMDDATVDDTARVLSVGALRYYMLRFSRNRVVAFDLDAALSFEGETGPYLQYGTVRARNILAKVAADPAPSSQASDLAAVVDLDAIAEDDRAEHWGLVQQLLRVPQVLEQAVESLELSMAAKHAYVLTQSFNTFYHRFPVGREPDPAIRLARLGVVRLFHDGMVDLLGLMGIEVPDRM